MQSAFDKANLNHHAY